MSWVYCLRPTEHPGYFVDRLGGVWSQRPVRRSKRWRDAPVQLNPSIDSKGRLRVCLSNRLHRFVHRLVLTAFRGGQPEGLVACHNDGDPANNRIENLRWDTQKSNIADKVLHGTQLLGSKHLNAKLSEAAVAVIRNSDASLQQLANRFGVSKQAVWMAKRGNTWREA